MIENSPDRFKVVRSLTDTVASHWYRDCSELQIPLILVVYKSGKFATVDWDCVTATDDFFSDRNLETKLSRKVFQIFSKYRCRRSALSGTAFVGQMTNIYLENATLAASRLAECFMEISPNRALEA